MREAKYWGRGNAALNPIKRGLGAFDTFKKNGNFFYEQLKSNLLLLQFQGIGLELSA